MIQPVIALIAWSMLMLVWLYVRRLPVLLRHIIFDARGTDGAPMSALPPQIQWPADNYSNLMEQPTLFYALCLGIYLSGLSNPDMEYMAWLYVALRVLHSLVQVTANITVIRLCLFLSGSAVLGLLCLDALKVAFHF